MTKGRIKQISKDPKSFLLKGHRLSELISAKRERVESWHELAESITVTLKPDGGTGSAYKQSLVENAVCNIADLENEIAAEIEELISIEKDIKEAIRLFVPDSRHKNILEMRYLNGYTLSSIGVRLQYGEDWVCRLHKEALQVMQDNAKKYFSEISAKPC